jgi:hypothetical protein
MLYKAQMQGIKAVSPKREAIRDFIEHSEEFMKQTAWSTPCRSWFKNGSVDGPVTALHPGSRIHWFQMLNDPRYEDWDWETFSGNRFGYLGNGFGVKESEGRDLTWYFDNPEEGYEHVSY